MRVSQQCMRGWTAVWLVTAVCIGTSFAGDNAHLVWKNADSLPGRLGPSDAGQVRWRSSLFKHDIAISRDMLNAVRFQGIDTNVSDEAFRIQTVSGDVLTGDLVGADQAAYRFSSRHCGDLSVPRDAVYRFERREHSGFAYKRASNFEDWVWWPESAWKVDNNGRMLQKPNTGKLVYGPYIFREMELPVRFELDVTLSCGAESLAFGLALSRRLGSAVRLETWFDEIVLVQGGRFEPVMNVKHQNEVRLRLVVDNEAGVVEVLDAYGSPLAKLDEIKPVDEAVGLVIRSRVKDMVVESLRLYRGIVKNRQRVDPAKERVHLVDRSVLYGRLVVDEQGTAVISEEGTRQPTDIKMIDSVVQPGIRKVGVSGPGEVTYRDGSVVRGRLGKLTEDHAVFQTAFSSNVVRCALARATELRFGVAGRAREASKKNDELLTEGTRLHGSLSLVEGTASPLRWRFEGAIEPVALSDSARGYFRKARVSKEPAYDMDAFPDLIYLRTQEVFPCRLTSYDEKSIRFESPFMVTNRLDAEMMKAIELSGGLSSVPVDFEDPRWQQRPQVLNRDEGHMLVTRQGNYRIWHDALLTRNEIHFDVHWENIRHASIYAAGFGGTGRQECGFRVNIREKDIEVLPRAPEAHSVQRGRLPKVGNRMSCRFRRVDNELQFLSGDRVLSKIRLRPNHRIGQRFSIVVEHTTPQRKGVAHHVKIDSWRHVSTLNVPRKKLERALLTPRAKRDNPDTHVVVSHTGDLLRGNLIEADADSITFMSASNEMKVPVERVSHIVDILKREPIGRTASKTGTVQVSLADGTTLVFKATGFEDGKLHGRSPVYGEVALPAQNIQHLRYNGFGAASFTLPFDKWVARPPREPSFLE